MTILTVYLIITAIVGIFMVTCCAIKDPDMKTNIRDWHWWLAIVIMSLIWPSVVLQLAKSIINKIVYSDEVGV